MSKHTPGPWQWQSNNLLSSESAEILSAGDDGAGYGQHVAVIDHHFDYEVKEANKYLIAAAPGLYEALDELVELEKSDLSGPEWKREIIAKIRQAERALSKARGEQ